jgi:flagellin-like hook-associated protein FlgL
MSVTAYTNVGGDFTRRVLKENTSSATKDLSKLSSGKQIVSQSDDALGAAMSDRISSSISTLNQSARNAAQGASVIQVASSSVEQQGLTVIRMKTLATNANSDAISPGDRALANEEFAVLKETIDNIAEQTRWSGQSLLKKDGSNAVKNEKSISGKFGELSNNEKKIVDQSHDISRSAKGSISGSVTNISTINGTGTNLAGAAAVVTTGGTGGPVIPTVSPATQSRILIQMSNGEVFENDAVAATEMDLSGTGTAVGTNNKEIKFTSITNPENSFSVKLGDSKSAMAVDDVANVMRKTFKVGSDVQPELKVGQSFQAKGLNTSGTKFIAPNAAATALTGNDIGPVNLKNSNTKGLISGDVKDINVDLTATGTLDIRVEIGNQTFRSENTAVGGGANQLVLKSTTDNSNQLTLNMSAGFADQNEATNQLNKLFGMEINKPASFKSASLGTSSTGDSTGIKSFNASSGVKIGEYSLSYKATNHELTLKDGNKTYTQTLIKSASGDSASFKTDSGSIDIEFNADFNRATDLSQVVLSVEEQGTKMEFQVGEKSTDIMTLNIKPTTTKALGLTDLSITTKEGARDALDSLDRASTILNTNNAQLGAKQKQFEITEKNINISTENMNKTLGSIRDADIASTMGNFTSHNVLIQLGQAMLSQSKQMSDSISSLVK